MLIAALGGILPAGANHLAALFLGIELISLPLFGLVGYAFRQKRSLEASIKYTILSAAASSFLLFGMALVYAELRQPVLPRAGQKPGGQHAARAAAAGGSWPDDCRSWL